MKEVADVYIIDVYQVRRKRALKRSHFLPVSTSASI
jgi:hypothetical protein